MKKVMKTIVTTAAIAVRTLFVTVSAAPPPIPISLRTPPDSTAFLTFSTTW